MNLGAGARGPRGESGEGPALDGPHIALLLPPCVALATSSIVSHQKLIVVWQTPFISPAHRPSPRGGVQEGQGDSGIIAVVVAAFAHAVMCGTVPLASVQH